MVDHQALPSLGFCRQEHWGGSPFPSPMPESEKGKWSCSVVCDSSRPHGLQPTRLLRPWDFPGKSTRVGCHYLYKPKSRSILQKSWPALFKAVKIIKNKEMFSVTLVIYSLVQIFVAPYCEEVEKAMSPHSSTLAWKIPWTEEPGGLQSMGSWRVGHDWATSLSLSCIGEGNGTPVQYSCLENPMDGGAWWAAVHGVARSRTWLSDFTFPFHFHALEKAMATHSSVLAWRIPGTAEPGGLPSMGSHRVWRNLAAAV